MRAIPLRCVADASVGIKLFIADALSDEAHNLFAHLADDPPAQINVPDLFFIECTNILWKYVRWSGYPAKQAREAIRDLGKLTLQGVPTSELAEASLEIAISQKITAYDACYVALSHRLEIPLITADEKLARTLAQGKYDLRWLGELM